VGTNQCRFSGTNCWIAMNGRNAMQRATIIQV
jgi:hypothetical protein